EPTKTVAEELGDCLFVLTCMANSLDIDMEKAHDTVMAKFKERDKDRWTKKEEKAK
ncbi:nucleotide pyrophosphohydrolase, partial [Escherichia coli]|nr:nucleotide pyrophosphohydrolase [Escherichia coli]